MNTTLFELYAIANILLRLETHTVLQGTELAKLATAVKKLLTINLKAYFGRELADVRQKAALVADDAAPTAAPEAAEKKTAPPPTAAAPAHNHKGGKGKKGKGKNKGRNNHNNNQQQQKKQVEESDHEEEVEVEAAPSTLASATPPIAIDDDSFIIQRLMDFMNSTDASSSSAVASSSSAAPVAGTSAYGRLRRDTKDPQSVMVDVPVRLTGMRSENEALGEGVVHYTIFSLEESGYGVDDTITAPLLGSEEASRAAIKKSYEATSKNSAASSPPPPLSPPQSASRLAFIVGPRGFVEEIGRESEDTSLAELAMLREVLTNRYRFSCHTLISNDLCAEECEDVIVDTIAEHLTTHGTIDQILVYLHTPEMAKKHPSNGMPYPQYCISFVHGDGSFLTHRAIINAIDAACVGTDAATDASAVGQVVVLHDCGSSLQLLSAVRGEGDGASSLSVGHHVALSLTEAAKSVVNCSRMWLYDGLFTPLVCEMLTVAADDTSSNAHATANAKRKGICAEDFINYATVALGYKAEEEEDCDEEEEEDEDEESNKPAPAHLLPTVGRSVIRGDATLSGTFL